MNDFLRWLKMSYIGGCWQPWPWGKRVCIGCAQRTRRPRRRADGILAYPSRCANCTQKN